LKSTSGAAGTQIVAAQLFDEFDIAVNVSFTALHPCFRWIGVATLAADLKRRADRRICDDLA
jgi:hypothetical protein